MSLSDSSYVPTSGEETEDSEYIVSIEEVQQQVGCAATVWGGNWETRLTTANGFGVCAEKI